MMIIDRRAESLRPILAESVGTSFAGDENLISRIMEAFIVTTQAARDFGDSEWNDVAKMQAGIQRAFSTRDFESAAAMLRNPGQTELFYGFDHCFAGRFPADPSYAALTALDALCRFAEVVGAIRTDNPESYDVRDLIVYDADQVMKAIENTIAWYFTTPNPFPGEIGVSTSRGIVSQRTPQALYQAWQVKKMVSHISNPRVVEIGGGLGRTAYYARELGVTDYTIVDLPMTSISQAYFLGRSLGEGALSLAGETPTASDDKKIKLRPPEWFLGVDETFDLVINVDSMTEMDRGVADSYWSKIKSSAGRFWSLNHEVNKFRVTDVIADRSPLLLVDRNFCWMRRGYVEESVTLRRTTG